jgi:polyhydroxyalkanoate synthase subunit PhaC
MAGDDTHETQTQMNSNVPGPDVMLRLWASWMDQMSAPAQGLADPGTAWWQMTARNPASSLIAGGVKQFQGHCCSNLKRA